MFVPIFISLMFYVYFILTMQLLLFVAMPLVFENLGREF